MIGYVLCFRRLPAALMQTLIVAAGWPLKPTLNLSPTGLPAVDVFPNAATRVIRSRAASILAFHSSSRSNDTLLAVANALLR